LQQGCEVFLAFEVHFLKPVNLETVGVLRLLCLFV